MHDLKCESDFVVVAVAVAVASANGAVEATTVPFYPSYSDHSYDSQSDYCNGISLLHFPLKMSSMGDAPAFFFA